jgi:methanogenic corrinoid protein MtbC1
VHVVNQTTELKESIFESMVAIDQERTPALVSEAVESGEDVIEIVDALTRGLKVVGEDFENLDRYLPELITAAQTMEECMGILRPKLEELDIEQGPGATIVMAQVEGDIHDIGRNIVNTMWRLAGFEVHDLGHDVKSSVIVDKAEEVGADIIGLSTLLTTSLPFCRDVVRMLDARDLRSRYKVIIGGGATTPGFVETIGADGCAPDAVSAVALVQNIIDGG